MNVMNLSFSELTALYEIYKTQFTAYFSRQVSFLIFFLKSHSLALDRFLPTTLIEYKQYLFSLRDSVGFFYLPSWIECNLTANRHFCNWLIQKNRLAENPFSPVYKKQLRKELSSFYTQRRLDWLSEREGSLTDAELVRCYQEHSQHYRSKYSKYVARVLKDLLTEAKEQDFSLTTLSEAHMRVLRGKWYQRELLPSSPPSNVIVLTWHLVVRHFYRFIYEEGYHRQLLFQHWEYRALLKTIRDERQALVQAQPLKSRYYSVKEILKSYFKFLKNTYKNYRDYQDYYDRIRQFLRFITTHKRTLYTVDASTIEAWKNHLLTHEYRPGCYYTSFFQVEKIRGVRRFYDWFIYHGYTLHHPLKDFNATHYQKEIAPLCAQRDQNKRLLPKVPDAFQTIYEGAHAHEQTLGLSKGTSKVHLRGWRVFFYYLETIGISHIQEVDEAVLDDYQCYVHALKDRNQKPLSIHTRVRHLSAVKSLFSYLARFKYLPRDPSLCIRFPKVGRGLPTVGMSDREIKKLFGLHPPFTAQEIRDRAILETLYSTGMRSNELCQLQVADVSFEMGLIRVNFPKGGRDFQRVVPIGKTACLWILRYLHEVRSKIETQSLHLFLNQQGVGLSTQSILNVVKSYAYKSGLRKRVVTHSFRVSCGTEMLKNKADLKFVQQQLGHIQISSTEKYMRLYPGDLKKVHNKCHPRERCREGRRENPCS